MIQLRSSIPIFDLGDWEACVVSGGGLALDGGAMFGSAPRALWERRIAPDAQHRIPLATRILALSHRREPWRVLVDAGVGTDIDDEFRARFAVIDPEGPAGASTLERAARAAGLEPEDVTHVLLTHLHFDHAGGVARLAGDEVRPALPGAELLVGAENLALARAPGPRERASYLPHVVAALDEAGHTPLADGDEPLPGLRVERSDGHTLGMLTLRVEGGGRVLRFPSDLAPTAHHVHLAFSMGYDMCPRELVGEKERAWRAALDEEATIVLQHDPRVIAGRLACRDGKYALEPIELE